MFFNSIEDQKKYIESQAQNRRRAASSIREIRNIVRKFDGKVYNCKFDEAIKALTDEENRFYCSNSYGWFYIHYTPRNGGYNNEITILSGYSCTTTDYIKHQTNDDAKIFDGKRIIADKMDAALKNKYESLLKEAYELEAAAEDLETTLDRFHKLKGMLNGLVQSLPDAVRDACNIKYSY